MTKIKAALLHLLISIVVISIFIGVVFYIWYPQPLFSIAHVSEPLKLLVLIDVVVGPALTFIVFSQKKSIKMLRLDLSFIALLQIAALSYGIYTIYNGRSAIIVFAEGRFNYLAEKFSNEDQLKSEELHSSFFSKPKLAYIHQLKTADIYDSYDQMLPLTDFEVLKSSAMNIENMKAKFKSKVIEINLIQERFPSDDIVFLTLDKDMSLSYVVYSKNRNEIIDELKF